MWVLHNYSFLLFFLGFGVCISVLENYEQSTVSQIAGIRSPISSIPRELSNAYENDSIELVLTRVDSPN